MVIELRLEKESYGRELGIRRKRRVKKMKGG